MGEWSLSVSELNEYVRRKLAGDAMLRNVSVRGEIVSFKRHVSGHLYFTLKDEQARVSCAMFRQQAARLDFQPADGMQVVVTGAAGLYPAGGTYQLYVDAMRREGAGDLFKRFEMLKRKLADEGLFDPALKKPLPLMPKTIGVATSAAGAAFHDIVRVARARNPRVGILLCPCAVQAGRWKTCGRSTRRSWRARWPCAERRWSPAWGTRSTLRSAISPPTCALPRRPTPLSWRSATFANGGRRAISA